MLGDRQKWENFLVKLSGMRLFRVVLVLEVQGLHDEFKRNREKIFNMHFAF